MLTAALALATIGFAGCAGVGGGGYGSAPSDGGDTGGRYGQPDDSGGAATAITSLGTADSDLGTIVVDDKGMTVYVFDNDTAGEPTSCSGSCVTQWPFVLADETPTLDGVTGEVGLVDTPDGDQQVTLDGWPLYYYVGDRAPGDVTGQGVGSVWWVVGADGQKITD